MIATSELDVFGLGIAVLLPWIAGIAWTHWLMRPMGRYNLSIALGYGYFVGFFLVTLLMRLWDAVLAELNFTGIAVLLGVSAVAGVLLQALRPAAARVASATAGTHLERALVVVLLTLLAWRYLTLGQELVLRPLFAWDAWMNWAPKAVVWFHLGTLAEFVGPGQWLQQDGVAAYTLGNSAASDYPIAVPLIQLWCMLGAGTWDHGAVYLPWLLAPLALALALFGHLRLAGVRLAPAVVGAYLLLSMPFVNVHTALAGYADIWLAAAFTLGVGALHEWQRERNWRWAAVWIVMAVFCAQLKVPGVFLALILVTCGLRAGLDLRPRIERGLLAAAILAVFVAMAAGFTAELPYLGRVAIGLDHLDLGRAGQFDLAYHPVAPAFARSFFTMLNWHLLGYLVPLLLVYLLWQRGLPARPGADVLAVVAAILFLAVVFFFTGYSRQALNFVTLNRALLYPVPALILCCFLSFFGAGTGHDRRSSDQPRRHQSRR